MEAMASWRRWRQVEISLGSRRCLIVISLLLTLLLLVVVAPINGLELPLQKPSGAPSGEIAKRATQLATTTTNTNANADSQDLDITINQHPSCDLLISANDNIGSYCQCKDTEYPTELNGLNDNGDGQENPTPSSSNSISNSNGGGHSNNLLLQINQLNCYPQNFTQIIEDLTQYLALNFSSQIQIDYLSINTNLTQKKSSFGVQFKSINHRRLLIDHISLQLTYSATNSRSSPDHHGKTIDSSAKSRAIEEQMIDFVHLINETHLQFLSIFLEDNSSGSSGNSGGFYNNNYNKFDHHLNSGNGNGTGRRFGDTAAPTRGGSGSGIKFARLLAILTGLTRLELSLGQKGGNELLLESGTFKEQGRLRWLNLASNEQVVLETNTARRSTFTYLPNLEYLSLESCNLESFPLYSLFTIPLQVGSPTNVSTRDNLSTKLHYYGLPYLNFLNLAGNRLTSFENDLFTRIANTNEDKELSQSMLAATVACYEKHDNNSKRFTLFHLPALTQLDLSHNRLRDITFKAGQYILCSMPNLNQLYLQHNMIVSLNLNSLLTNPISIPYPFQAIIKNNFGNDGTTNYKLQVDTFSQLEHIDLSHNHLSKITAIQWVGNTTSMTRVKSINLSHNKLQQPTIPLDSKLVNRLIFKESFDLIEKGTRPEILSLEHLESLLTLYSMELGSTVSICDFLSPASSRSPLNNDLLNELLLTNNELSHIDSNYFSSKQCKDIQILRLSKNRIESLAPEALFELRNLEQLDLSNNMISHLKEETFMKNIRLRILDLSFNRIGLIERNLFSHLTELESLSLSDNQLFALPNELFNHNNQLEIIDLSNNKLNHLYDSFFYHSRYLRLLNLRGNHLKKFSHQAFELIAGFSNKDTATISTSNSASPASSLKSLPATTNNKRFNSNLRAQKLPKRRHNRQTTEDANVLILAFNQVDSIQFDKCVQFGQNIQLLRLNNNRLRELHDTSFKCFRSVQRLHLNSNRIRYIGDFTFHHLTQLEYLDLSRNILSQVQADSFKFPNALSYLDLSFNQLVGFKFIDSFASLRDTNASMESVSMEIIKLGENPDLALDLEDLISFTARVDLRQIELGNIGRIESIISAPMKVEKSRIQLLNLSSINHINESLLNNLSEPTVLIERIDMSHSTIPSNKLIDFLRKKLRHELSELNIGGNQYGTSQVVQLFDNLDMTYQLQLLNISDNLIEHWPFNSRIAPKLHKLRSIDLSQNKLRQFIRDETVNYIFPELELLNLSSNALVSLADNLKQRMIYLKNLMPRIKQLDLSNNRLTWIPLQFLDDLQELTWLKLNNNQLESLSPILASQRLVLDLSSNNKLRAMVGGLELNAYQTDVIDCENLILHVDHNDDHNNNYWMPRMECQTIEDYIEAHREPYRLRSTPSDHQETSFLEWNVMNDDERVNDDKCQSLIQSIDTILLDSISGLINLNSIQTVGNKFIHLSLRHIGLGQIETSDRNSNIVLLDLSHNKIHDLPSTMCRNLIELRSLDLSNNQLIVIPYEKISLCQKLNYLDLAHNKITSLVAKENTSDILNLSALLVINLNNNMLRDLYGIDSKFFQSLRFLDLRLNQLKSDLSIPKLYRTHFLLSSPLDMKNSNHIIKPHLKINDSFLLMDDQEANTKKEVAGHSVNLYDIGGENNLIAHHPASHRHLIKFCALNMTGNHIRVCFGRELDQSNEIQCFLLIVPANLPSCLTYLHEPSSSSSANNIDSNSTVTNSSLFSLTRRDGFDSLETDADPILVFIDSLKSYWLKLREMDINDYIASIINVRNDSIYIIMDGRYTIYTLTLVKILIVGGSVCIVALLIAMFALLTCRSTDRDQLSPKSESELTNVMNTDFDATDSSITNNSGDSNNLMTSSHTQRSASPAPATCSSARSKSTSDNDDETQKNTILERKTSIHQQLDTNQLMLQNQACSTPSSSLAPSSVETAETLQAIDSIKSGTPIQHFGGGAMKPSSVDQYAESINNPVGNLHPQYQVATVMRMVKSNSANQFDPSNRNSSNGQFNGHSTYGTLNHRNPNYPTIKSRLRAIYENQQQKQHQIFPTISGQSQRPADVSQNELNQQQNSYGYVQPSTYYIAQEDSDLMMMNLPELSNQISQQQDPTTVSLLPINPTLSSNHHSSHRGINQQFLQDTYMDTLKSSDSQVPSLCHYHRLVHESGVPSNATGLIGLERHEEEQYSNNDDLAMMNNLPPPPSSRAIEALENTITNMSTTASHELHFSHN